jgi:hypothetical protein
MTKTVLLSIENTVEAALPADVTFAGFKFTLRSLQPGVPDAASSLVTETVYTFPEVPLGMYVAEVVAIGSNNEPLGAAVSIKVEVADVAPPPVLTYQQPATLGYSIL